MGSKVTREYFNSPQVRNYIVHNFKKFLVNNVIVISSKALCYTILFLGTDTIYLGAGPVQMKIKAIKSSIAFVKGSGFVIFGVVLFLSGYPILQYFSLAPFRQGVINFNNYVTRDHLDVRYRRFQSPISTNTSYKQPAGSCRFWEVECFSNSFKTMAGMLKTWIWGWNCIR